MTCIISETALSLATQLEGTIESSSALTFARTMERLGIWMSEDDPEFAEQVESLLEPFEGYVEAGTLVAIISPALRDEAATLSAQCLVIPHNLCQPMDPSEP